MTSSERIPNFWSDETQALVYRPVHIDSSFIEIMRHHGIPDRRIAVLLTDLDNTTGHVFTELESILPVQSSVRLEHSTPYNIEIEALLEEQMVWSGNKLTINRTYPQTVTDSLVGMKLTTIVDHPALPTRAITSAQTINSQTVLTVERDLIQLADAAVMVQSDVRPSKDRLNDRKAWVTQQRKALGQSPTQWEGDRRKHRRDNHQLNIKTAISPYCWGETVPPPPSKLRRWITTHFKQNSRMAA